MERVLIVAKTIMGDGLCIGGLTANKQSVRLIPQDRQEKRNYPSNTPLRVGQVWEMELQKPTELTPPHVEDVLVTHQKYLYDAMNVRDILLHIAPIWRGGPEALFDGLLTLQRTKAYLAPNNPIPPCSTGFWIPNEKLTLTTLYRKKYYYQYRSEQQAREETLLLSYVGFIQPIAEIPAQTLLRVSLSRWWSPDEDTEKRCYVQLSGWFL